MIGSVEGCPNALMPLILLIVYATKRCFELHTKRPLHAELLAADKLNFEPHVKLQAPASWNLQQQLFAIRAGIASTVAGEAEAVAVRLPSTAAGYAQFGVKALQVNVGTSSSDGCLSADDVLQHGWESVGGVMIKGNVSGKEEQLVMEMLTFYGKKHREALVTVAFVQGLHHSLHKVIID